MQVNLMECNVTRVWITLVFVPSNSTTPDPTDTQQPKDSEKHQEPVMDDLWVSEWCNEKAELQVDSQETCGVISWDNTGTAKC